jgi:hypothetical protein
MPSEYRPERASLVGSRLKAERAGQHLDELEPEIRAYVEREPFTLSEKPELEDDWLVTRITEIREYPDPRWGVRIGEFLHDLRSALDNLIWQLVLVNGHEPGDHNQFPIYYDPDRKPGKARLKQLKGVPGATRLDDMLFGVATEHVAVIKELQPYLGTHIHRDAKIALTALAELNNIDKHRFLHPTFGVRQEGTGEAKLLGGPQPREIEAIHTTGRMYPGAEMLRWRVVGGTNETEVQVEGELPFDIAFGHSKATLSFLDGLQEQIARIIEGFAPAFPPDPDGSH